MKKFLIKLLFNKRQRMTMWHALVYSAYKYRKHGNVDAAVKVQMVMDEVQNKLGIVPTTFTKDEVDKIVNGVMNDAKKMEQNAYKAGVKQGIKQANVNENKNKPVVFMIGVGSVVDLNKCEKCESKDGCIIYNSIKEVENDNNGDEKPQEEQPTEQEEKPTEQEEQPNDEEQKVETESETPTNETEAVEEDKQ